LLTKLGEGFSTVFGHPGFYTFFLQPKIKYIYKFLGYIIMSKYKGVIQHWCNIKGYGIVDYNDKNAFVHISNCVRDDNEWLSFKSGDEIIFEMKDNIAYNVIKYDGTTTPPYITTNDSAKKTPG